MYANIFLIGNISSRTNIAAKFGPGPNMAAIFGPTGQNMDATFGPRADIIWHGRTEYGSHILSGRTKYGSHIWSRTKFGSHNRSAGQFLGRTFCAVTGAFVPGRHYATEVTNGITIMRKEFTSASEPVRQVRRPPDQFFLNK